MNATSFFPSWFFLTAFYKLWVRAKEIRGCYDVKSNIDKDGGVGVSVDFVQNPAVV